MIRNWIRPLFVVGALGLCFFYIWGCSFGSSSGGTVSNPVGADTTPVGIQSFEQENIAIQGQFINLNQALVQKTPEACLNLFAPEIRENYRAFFSNHIDKLPELANALALVTLTNLNDGINQAPDPTAEVELSIDGLKYHIQLRKTGSTWFFTGF